MYVGNFGYEIKIIIKLYKIERLKNVNPTNREPVEFSLCEWSFSTQVPFSNKLKPSLSSTSSFRTTVFICNGNQEKIEKFFTGSKTRFKADSVQGFVGADCIDITAWVIQRNEKFNECNIYMEILVDAYLFMSVKSKVYAISK